jgi:hypothetical protein
MRNHLGSAKNVHGGSGGGEVVNRLKPLGIWHITARTFSEFWCRKAGNRPVLSRISRSRVSPSAANRRFSEKTWCPP